MPGEQCVPVERMRGKVRPLPESERQSVEQGNIADPIVEMKRDGYAVVERHQSRPDRFELLGHEVMRGEAGMHRRALNQQVQRQSFVGLLQQLVVGTSLLTVTAGVPLLHVARLWAGVRSGPAARPD